ncbi:Aldo/keto reductase [Fragilariopsis cylindrus CCMP1102]|uniref:Aldo/keto reductase n=1 Tax=Fragilariopsis cylindrus CCMP1102 TaxID=635003 RepID=A0A1E7FRR9_9STRA|nr:Aldo/keto reductase [Fragilariopsis cylindrus CCMP1102]|eukprot:OEU20523.1 Aldo/keto reductase [Fragilariopsis cylindrus CCMP1102]
MIGNHKTSLPLVAWFVAIQSTDVVDAFNIGGGPLLSSSSSLQHQSSSSSFRLFSSPIDDGDDELSKLIGKRGNIRRKTKEELPNEESVFEALTEELGKMPEFTAKRPVRQAKSQKEEDAENAKQNAARRGNTNEPTYVDFMVDYDDENDFHIPNRMGISTRCWGEEREGFVSSGKLKKSQLRAGKFVPGDLQMAYNNLLEEGILLFDTSPAYGKSMSSMKLSGEDILSRCIREYQENDTKPLVMNTFPNQIWQRTSKALTSALTSSCEKMELTDVEVYQTKNVGWLPSGGIVKGMAEAVIDQGTTNFAGVQDVSPLRLRRLNSKLDKLDTTLTTNSFEFSLTDRKKEKWITACKSLGIVPLIRNPLGSGLASGQYTATNPSGGLTSGGMTQFAFKTLEKYQPLHSVLESVAERVRTRLLRSNKEIKNKSRQKGPPPKINTEITTTQVALNYIVAKGGVPLAEVNSPKQAQEVIGCLGWTLTDDEVSLLESASGLCS